jgi:hypothetical protein
MRMLHIRNMHQLASAAISPLHEDSPARPRLVGSRKPDADHDRLVYHPLRALLALRQLLATTSNFHSGTRACHWPSARPASSTGEASRPM